MCINRRRGDKEENGNREGMQHEVGEMEEKENMRRRNVELESEPSVLGPGGITVLLSRAAKFTFQAAPFSNFAKIMCITTKHLINAYSILHVAKIRYNQ